LARGRQERWPVHHFERDFLFHTNTTAPTASLGGASPVTGASSLDFTVTYSDALTGMDVSSLDNSDITVTGPNGYSANATYISSTTAPTVRRAWRLIDPRTGGFWNDFDNGSYTVTQNGSQVKDVATNASAAGTIEPSTSPTSARMDERFGPQRSLRRNGDSLALSTSGSNIAVTKNGNTSNFAGVTSISVVGSTPTIACKSTPRSPAARFR